LELRLRAMIFRLGAAGENGVVRFPGENNPHAGKKKKGGHPSACYQAPDLGIKICHLWN